MSLSSQPSESPRRAEFNNLYTNAINAYLRWAKENKWTPVSGLPTDISAYSGLDVYLPKIPGDTVNPEAQAVLDFLDFLGDENYEALRPGDPVAGFKLKIPA